MEGKENQLTAKLATQVEKKEKEEGKLATATKAKQVKAPQAEKPPEEKFLSAKELAQMAGVEPTILRKILRQNFAGKIPRSEDGKQYQIKASNPLVQEIIAKVKEKGNGNKPAEASKAVEAKGEGDEPSPASQQQGES